MMCDEEVEVPPWCGGSDTIVGAGLRNLVEGMMQHLQSGHVEFDCNQLHMQLI